MDVLISENKGFHFKIMDNGIGFDEDHVALGNGINNMKKRARDLKGTFTISSSGKNGTTVTVNIPKQTI